MEAPAFHKIYYELTEITKATCVVYANGVSNEEMAYVAGRPAQVIKLEGSKVTLQVFSGTQGLKTDSEILFTGSSPQIKVSENLLGRFINSYGEPIDNGPKILGDYIEIGGPAVNPIKRQKPYKIIKTGLSGIDLNNTVVAGQKIPFFSDPDQPFNQVMAMIAQKSKVDYIIIGGIGLTHDDYIFYKDFFYQSGSLDNIIGVINTTQESAVERLLVPDTCLSIAEYFSIKKGKNVLVLLSDMTLYAEALAIVSNRMDQIPSKDSMPGSLYSDLARLYEKAVQLPNGGSITILSVTTLSGGDITHSIPDNTGYITEGQLFLRYDDKIGKTIIDPFRSLSRLKQLVIGKTTRDDHPQVMNTAIRLYSDAANALTKQDNGFDLTEYDKRCISFSYDYSKNILSITEGGDIDHILDQLWKLFEKYFHFDEIQIKQEFYDKYSPSHKNNEVTV